MVDDTLYDDMVSNGASSSPNSDLMLNADIDDRGIYGHEGGSGGEEENHYMRSGEDSSNEYNPLMDEESQDTGGYQIGLPGEEDEEQKEETGMFDDEKTASMPGGFGSDGVSDMNDTGFGRDTLESSDGSTIDDAVKKAEQDSRYSSKKELHTNFD